MTAKQRVFAGEYAVDLNATRAAVRAGYSSKTADRQGHRLLRNVEVREAIAHDIGGRMERLELTSDVIVDGIRSTVEAAQAEKQYATALKGYELLGRHLGMFKDHQAAMDLASLPRVIIDL